MRQRTTTLTTLLLLALVISACSSPVTTLPSTSVAQASPPAAETATGTATSVPTAETPTVLTTPTEDSTPTAVATPTTESTPTAETTTAEAVATPDETATETVSERQVLEAKYYQDSDGNDVPDFLEVEFGYDPNADDCAQQQCGEGAEGTDFLFKERNTLLMLDSSGSMAAQVPGGNKLDVAKQALRGYVGFATAVSQVGFLVYGHKGNNTEAGKPESCVGIDLLSPIGQVQFESFSGTLDQFQPTGWTPIAAALTKAGEAFVGKEDAVNRIIMVSDGIETCEGDPVAVAQQLHNDGLAIQISVIGFDIAEGSADQAQLRKIAEVTNGEYFDAKTADDLNNYFREEGERLSKTFEAFVCEAGNSNSASLCDLTLISQTSSYLQKMIFDPSTPEDESDAYQALINKIQDGRDERQVARDEARKRVDELAGKYRKLLEQLARAANGQNPP